MKLKLKNIGKIHQADVELTTLTLIAGNNNMGKSTVGKSLYALSSALEQMSLKNLLKDKLNELRHIFSYLRRNPETKSLFATYEPSYGNLASQLLETDKFALITIKAIDNDLSQLIHHLQNELLKLNEAPALQRTVSLPILQLEELAKLSIFDQQAQLNALQKALTLEFADDIAAKYQQIDSSHIDFLEDNGDHLSITFSGQKIVEDQVKIEIDHLYTAAIYIDDPFVFDKELALFPTHSSHKTRLYDWLKFNELKSNYFEQDIKKQLLEKIFSTTLVGTIHKDAQGVRYSSEKLTKAIDFSNLSTGMKSFGIMRMLIESGMLEEHDYLILDEPEIHLHPEWQIEYARLVVNISKIFPIKILITSHSPYFIEAIDLFSQEAAIPDVKYYKAIPSKEIDEMVTLQDVSENLEEIYQDMYRPLNYLKELREELELD